MKNFQLDFFLAEEGLEFSYLQAIAADLEKHYSQVRVRKRISGYREISIPSAELKWIQTRILAYLKKHTFEFPSYVQGGIKGRSSRTNAEFHVGANVVLNLDLKNYFQSIDTAKVKCALIKLGFDDNLSDILAELATFRGTLPQGASTSVFLANLVGLEIDEKLMAVESSSKVTYTRYIDDISVSGTFDVDEIVRLYSKEIENLGFSVNSDKTRIQRRHRRQSVNGVVVNTRVRVPRAFIKSLEHDLYFSKKFGIFGHCEEIGDDQASFVKRLASRIGYVISIEPVVGARYLKSFRELRDGLIGEKHYMALQRVLEMSQSN